MVAGSARKFAWHVLVWAVATVGILGFFLPLALQARWGDGEPNAFLADGLRVWLVVMSVVALVAVSVRALRPRLTAAKRDLLADLEQEPIVVGLGWSGLLLGLVTVIFGLDGEPRWLVWVAGAAWVYVTAVAAYVMWPKDRAAQRAWREQQLRTLDADPRSDRIDGEA